MKQTAYQHIGEIQYPRRRLATGAAGSKLVRGSDEMPEHTIDEYLDWIDSEQKECES